MARLQILELPEGASDERAPFVLIVDEASFPTVEAYQAAEGWWKQLAQQIGARGCILTDDTMDIPANDTTAYLSSEGGDGTTVGAVHVRVEPDFEQFHERVQDEIRKAQGELVRALNRDA